MPIQLLEKKGHLRSRIDELDSPPENPGDQIEVPKVVELLAVSKSGSTPETQNMQSTKTRDRLDVLFRNAFSDKALSPDRQIRVRKYISDRIGHLDAAGEGFRSPEKQRDISIKFYWGHNHWLADDFHVKGWMQDRHIDLLTTFIDEYGLEMDLRGKSVLDIGCWTGGTSLALAALGADVTAIEEVRKYADVVNFLAEIFSLSDRLRCFPESLYEVLPRYADYFDIVLYAGVVYHVTDPLLSLRRVFTALKDGGRCFIESYGNSSGQSLCLYEGSHYFHGGSREGLSRSGWNYFVPSPKCLENWCRDVGFSEITVGPCQNARVMAMAQRMQFADILRSGLSRKDCR